MGTAAATATIVTGVARLVGIRNRRIGKTAERIIIAVMIDDGAEVAAAIGGMIAGNVVAAGVARVKPNGVASKRKSRENVNGSRGSARRKSKGSAFACWRPR